MAKVHAPETAFVPPRVEVAEAAMRMERVPLPGARIELVIPPDETPGTLYRWVQLMGPRVEIETPTTPTVEITVPETVEPLVFLRVGSTRDLIRIVRVDVATGRAGNAIPTISAPSGSTSPTTKPSGSLQADAGDDQVGLVGHRVTMNGSRSAPSENLSYRWVQLSGPPLGAPQQDRAFFSFIPREPGVYRMALIVADSGAMSEPDEVAILVGVGPQGFPGTLTTAVGAGAASIATPEQILRASIAILPGGRPLAKDLATEFDLLASRTSLYNSFAELQNDLGRRLDAVIPADIVFRQAWSQAIFQPLTLYTTNHLLNMGLDIRQASGLNGKLTPTQQDNIHDHLKAVAAAFRAVSSAK